MGATCNPVIVLGVLKKELANWKGRIETLLREFPTAGEDEIAWKVVREISVRAAALLKPSFDAREYLPLKRQHIVVSALMRRCASRCRNAWQWQRPWSAA